MATYLEHEPSAALRPYVACYWTLRGRAASPSRILPDCCADLLFDLGMGRASLVGAMSTAAVFEQPGRVDLLGVRFRPGGARPFFGMPLREVTDRVVPATGEIVERLVEAQEPLPVLETALLARATGLPDPLVAAGVAELEATSGGARVATLARRLGVGERRLLRHFDDEVGLSPKELARVIRFRRALRLAGRRAWTEIAAQCGYADQAHLVREFGRLAGISPVRFVQDSGAAAT